MAMTAMAAAAIAGPIVGGILGNALASGDRAAARDAAARATQEAMALGLPPDLAKEIVLQQFRSAGNVTPELEEAVGMGISQVAQIQEDPGLRDAQTNALQLLQQRGQTGLTPEDRAALNQVRSEVQRDTEAKRQQILQSFQMRGMGGSGAELAAQLQAAQGGSNQASEQGDRIAAMASANALQAMTNAGQLGGQIRGQDFDVSNAKATAADQFKRLDVDNQMNVNARNVAAKNAAQEANLSNQQRLMDANTNQANNELYRQSQAKEQYWQDLKDRSQLRSNAQLGQASNLQNSANQTAQMYQGIGTGTGQAAGAMYGYQNQAKTNDIAGQRLQLDQAKFDADQAAKKKPGT